MKMIPTIIETPNRETHFLLPFRWKKCIELPFIRLKKCSSIKLCKHATLAVQVCKIREEPTRQCQSGMGEYCKITFPSKISVAFMRKIEV